MNTAKKFIGALLVTAAVGTSIVSAQSTDATTSTTKKFNSENRQKINALIEAGDYNGWKALLTEEGRTAMADKVTADQFAKMTEMANALKDKDFAKAKELRQEAGQNFAMNHPVLANQFQKIKRSVKNDALESLPQAVKDQLDAARKAGDKDAVKKILEDNGIKMPMGMPGRGRMGIKQLDLFKNLPQTAKDQLKTAFQNHDKAAIDQILKDNGIELPVKPVNVQDTQDASSST